MPSRPLLLRLPAVWHPTEKPKGLGLWDQGGCGLGLTLKGCNDPNNGVLGPKYYHVNGIWALKPYYLGPWTLRVRGWFQGVGLYSMVQGFRA